MNEEGRERVREKEAQEERERMGLGVLELEETEGREGEMEEGEKLASILKAWLVCRKMSILSGRDVWLNRSTCGGGGAGAGDATVGEGELL